MCVSLVRGRRNYHSFFAFAYFLTVFCHTLSCEVTISPLEKISVLNGSYVTVTCKASCGSPILSVHEKKRGMDDYQETEFLNHGGHNDNTFSDIVTARNNGSSIYCYDAISGTNSTPVTILVQDSIDAIAGFRVKKTLDSLKISWTPVFAYEGLIVQYIVSFNGDVTNTSKTWTTLSTSGLNECQFTNLNITSIISDSIQTLNNTNQWSIQIETPPSISNLKYTMMMGKNGSIFLNLTFEFNLTDCNCPGRLNGTVLTITSDTHTFDDVPAQSNNCIGFTKLLLPPFANITSIAVTNSVGTIPSKPVAFDINPLRNISYPSPSSVQCIFTDSIMTINNYSTGCLYYNNMGEPVSIPRENYESNVTTRVSSNGQTCFFPLPLPVNQHCQNISIDISATQTEKILSSTAHHESTSTVISTTSSSLPSWSNENYVFIFVLGFTGALLGACTLCIGAVVGLILLYWVLKYCFKCKAVTLHLENRDTNTAPIGTPISAPVHVPIPASRASPNTITDLVVSRTTPSQNHQGYDPTSNYVSAGSQFSRRSISGHEQQDDRVAPPENRHDSIVQNLSNQTDAQL